MGILIWPFKAVLFLLKVVMVLVIFTIDHLLGAVAGVFVGLFKGLSGLFGLGIRGFARGILKTSGG